MLYLACILQLDHCFYCLLDWRYFVEPVDIVQIDIRQAEPFERLLDRSLAIVRTRVNLYLGFRARSIDLNCKLRSQEDILALFWVGSEPFANDIL